MLQQKELPIEYIIVSILANMPESISTLPTKKPILHKAFYQLRNQKYSLLQGIAFETNYFPYSESIEQAFNNIEMSRLISKINPVIQKFSLDKKKLSNFYEKEIKNKLTSSQIEEIETIAKNFLSLVLMNVYP